MIVNICAHIYEAIINTIVCMITFSECLLLVYIKPTNF